MTLEEANKVAAIIATADGGCSVCVGNLVERMQKAFPEFRWEEETETYHDPDWMDDGETGERDTVRAYPVSPGNRQ